MYDCSYQVPSDGIVDNFPKVKNSTCSYCAEVCEPPQIDMTIHFLDGFSGSSGWLALGLFLGITLVIQAYQCCYKKPRVEKEWEEIVKDTTNRFQNSIDPIRFSNDTLLRTSGGSSIVNINKTQSSSQVNQYQN